MVAELSAEQANRHYYEHVAASYDETEACITRESDRARLAEALTTALEMLDPRPRVLDACGGTGNASELLLRRGVDTLLVDLSPEMTELWRRKARSLGHDPEIELAPIDDFLDRDSRSWDLIVFSSALHHLEDFELVLRSAVGRLATGGVLLTMFDPTRLNKVGRFLRRLDWIIWRLLHEPRTMPAQINIWLRRKVRGDRPELTVGRRAERYAASGIDDLGLVDTLSGSGLTVVEHRRMHDARYGFVRAAFAILGQPSSFSIIAQRAGSIQGPRANRER